MTIQSLRKPIAWLLIFLLGYGPAIQAATLTLAATPLAATTTSVVRPNLMYVLDDSGSMGWDYTPDYINDGSVTDPTNAGIGPPGSSGDTGSATIAGGVITAISATGGNVYQHATPTVLIQGDGTGAAATVTMNANRTIASVQMVSGGSGYTAANTFITFLGGLKSSGWGMCWGTTGASDQGGAPKDSSSNPACTTRSQVPYSTSKVNYQYYDPAVRYTAPLKADGTSYADMTTPTSVKSDGFAGTGAVNLTTSYQHEIWCSQATPSPALATNATTSTTTNSTHAQCKENLDTSNNALYPNATYTFRKTYNGPAYYYTMEASEYCTSTTYTSCITRDQALTATPAFVVGGVTYNVPSYYRWCSYYNSKSKTFGGCQGTRDLDHYIPNYLGGWVSPAGAAGVQATASLVISPTTAGQQLNTVTVGGASIVGSTTFTSAANGDQNTMASNICTAIQANTATTGYSCAATTNTVLIQAAAVGDAFNGLPVLATGPADGAAVNSTGEIRVTTATAGLTIAGITINGNQLLSATVTADGSQANTARMICEAINSGAQQGVYIARSGDPLSLPAYGTCNTDANAYIQVKRIPADTTDNGQAITVTGPATATISTGAIQINSTSGATSITDVTLDGVSIIDTPPMSIADGTQTTSIATSLKTKINTKGTCTATSSGNVVTLTGCTGTTLLVSSSSALATATMKVTSTTHTYGADLGGIQVSGTSIAGHITSGTLTNGTSVSTNATAIRTAINAGTGTHGFSAAVPTVSGSDYNMVVTAPAGTAYNGQSFTFQNGTAVAGGVATSPTWAFSITNATADSASLSYIRCDASDSSTTDDIYPLPTAVDTGTAPSAARQRTDNLASGLNANYINGYTYSCTYVGGTTDDQRCQVTGPTGASACTGDLSFTKDGTITTKNYVKTAAAATACPAITAPTWQFRLSGSVDNDTINAITCGGTNTLNATVYAGNGNGDDRRQQLGDQMQNKDTNGYTYSCSYNSSANQLTCTVTGPTAAAACTTLDLSNRSPGIVVDYNNNVSQTCSAISPANSATWRFDIDSATADNKLFNSIKCPAGGTNTITTDTVSSGSGGADPTVTRINNLKTAIEANDSNGYTISCSTATTTTVRSDCTITGPAGTNACQGTDTGDSNNCGVGQMTFKYNGNEDGSGIVIDATGIVHTDSGGTWRSCVPSTSNGSSGGTAVDDFAPYLFTVSAFSGGSPAQGTTVTQITSTNVGKIGTTTVAMTNGVASAINAIPTNATGTAPNVLNMTGGSNANTATNRWTDAGIFKRVDLINDGRTFTRASGRTDCVGSTCSYTEEMKNFANWYAYYRTRMLMMKSATTLAFTQLDGNYRVGFDNICQATGTTVDNPVNQFSGANRTSWWTSLTSATPSCATPLRAETAKIGRYYSYKLNATQPDPIEYSCQQNYMLLVTDGYWNESDSSSIKRVDGTDIANTDDNVSTAARPYYDGAQASTACPTVGTTRSTASSCRTLADIAYHYYSTDLRSSALGNATNTALGRDVSTNNVLTTADDKNLAQHMNFFAMGLGIDGRLAFRSDYQTAATGDYADIISGSKNWPAVANLDPTAVDDLWHATVNGRGKYFSARNVPAVVAGLREALNKIGARVGSAAAAATSNLEPVPGDNFAYVASYTTQDWTGDLQSRSINVATGDVSPETNCSSLGVQTTISGLAGATTITVADPTDLVVGAAVSGTGIATGAVVTAVSGTGLTLSAANTGAVSGTGTFKYGCQWSAMAKLDAMTWSARRLYVKPSSGTTGDPLRAFTYDNLSVAEKAYFNPGPDACVGAANPVPTTNLSQYCPLGGVATVSEMSAANLVDFVRGNRGLEQDGNVGHAQVWRHRAHVLGDIVNTQPIFVKAPSAAFTDTGYSTFKTAQAARKPLVFVSSQDGMLHAFNAYGGNVTVNGTAVGPGEEMWAFMPSEAMQTAKFLGDANYTHRFFVDGQIAVGDVDFGGSNWHTILVGGLGAGGNSYYALDITDPTDPKYLWEFSHANLGKTFSNVAITKLHNGEWSVMFSSGYNNGTTSGGDGIGYLYALNPQTGAVKSGFPMSNLSGSGASPSNLGKITPWADSPATNNTTEFVYAGDTNGDLWRFDLDPTATGHTNTAVFKLAHLEHSGTPQPITTKPDVTLLEDDVRLIMVGTGKYLEVADLTNTEVQAIYAMKDTMGAANKGGAGQETWNPETDMLTSDPTKPVFLQRKLHTVDQNTDPITRQNSYGQTEVLRKICAGASSTVTSSGSAPNKTYTCGNTDTTTLDFAIHGGWYAQFPDSGERMNVDPRIVRGTLIFASNVPGADSCTVGGNSWFTYLDAATGLALEEFASTKISGALVVGLTVIRLSTGEYKAIATRSDYKQETLSVPVAAAAATSNTFQQKRGLWREFEAY